MPNQRSSNTDNILVVGPSWVGDMVMAQSLFKALKQQNPACAIDVIAPGWSVPVLERMPEVRRGIPLHIGHGEFNLKARYRLGKELRNQYQRAIVLPRSLKAALVPFFANIPVRTGFLGEMRYGILNDIREFNKKHLNQTVKRFTALGATKSAAQQSTALQATPIHFPALRIDKDAQLQVLKKLQLSTTQPAVSLFPGAEYGPAKQWPIEHYAELASALTQDGYQVWIMGSQKDGAVAENIIDRVKTDQSISLTNLCGKTSLAEAIDLIGHCKAAVSNDSGLMHVAAAADCPVIGIYGSSSPDFTPPLTKKSKVLHLNLDCSPCFERTCPLQHLDCLYKITPKSVFDALKMLLSD
jgi:heptosyltransferase-2